MRDRYFQVGDLVTRDGTDVQRVIKVFGADGYPPERMVVVCVKAPSGGWCMVGDEEDNLCGRYRLVQGCSQ